MTPSTKSGRALPEWLDRAKNPAACDLTLAVIRTSRLKAEVIEEMVSAALAEAAAAAIERAYDALKAMFVREGRRPVTLMEIEATIRDLRDAEPAP